MDLKELRANKGFQRKFVVSKISISSKHLNDIEAGRVNLTEKMASRLSEFYKIDINAIKDMYMEGKMKREEILSKQSELLKEVELLSQTKKTSNNSTKHAKHTIANRLI